MTTNFIDKIHNHAPAIGTIVTLDSPEIAEILSLCGFDWLFLDMEHGTLAPTATQRLIQAMRGSCSAVVRIPGNDPIWFKKALDTGCDGIVVPLVNSVNEARQAVAASKFPPQGARSVGVARAHGYGMSFPEYVASANERVALIIQIEHIEAINHLDGILAVPGIDGVLIGPYDLSGSMNRLGDVTSEPVQTAIQVIKQKCQAKAVPYGIFVMNADLAQKEIQDGCQFIAVGIDTVLLSNAAKAALNTVKGVKS